MAARRKNLLLNILIVVGTVVMTGALTFSAVAYVGTIQNRQIDTAQSNAIYDNCAQSIARSELVEQQWRKRAALERNAAKRGYPTAPEWEALANQDDLYADQLKKNRCKQGAP